MNRTEKLIRAAFKASFSADPTCAFPIGAVVAKGNKIISTGANSHKTHPRTFLYSSFPRQLHAEVKAILGAVRILKDEDLSQCSIYVVRRSKTGLMTMAKPCQYCSRLLHDVGIRWIYYTDHQGHTQQMEIA